MILPVLDPQCSELRVFRKFALRFYFKFSPTEISGEIGYVAATANKLVVLTIYPDFWGCWVAKKAKWACRASVRPGLENSDQIADFGLG